eukprot:TRINITY_DN3082_c0_g1_i1.p1 TRINITY_DN3082_c0_g1~~TRINITY_DN3082_c0_g1_i1.p1  ORF type:complete len:347 (-),score=71.12 TRINITY_DN3082_c0_g1_i1:95-1135(-)
MSTKKLNYVYLGWSGLKVSELALGPFSSNLDAKSGETFVQVVDRYIEAGGNFIDLADAYTGAEKLFGEHLATGRWGTRESLVIASKTGLSIYGGGPNDVGLSRKHIYDALDKTLKDLKTDYIDIYYAHMWDYGISVEELLRTWENLVRSGKVRYVAASNFTSWQVQKIVDYAKFLNLEKIVALQQQYNLIDRFPEYEQIPACENENVAVIAWGPLSAGWLSGKIKRDNQTIDPNSRIAVETNQWKLTVNSAEAKGNERTWAIIDVLLEVAKETGKTPSQVAVNWLTKRALPILGPRTLEQLEDGLGSVGWSLSEEQRKKLDQVSRLPPSPLDTFYQGNPSTHRQRH